MEILLTCKITWGCEVKFIGSEQRLHTEIEVNGPNCVPLQPQARKYIKNIFKNFDLK